MNWFIEPIRDHYVDFEGRVTLKPFWMFVLIYVVLSIIVGSVLEILQTILALALLLPSIGITTRRLHDTGKSGWWQLLWFVPIVGWVILIVFLAQESEQHDNVYGTKPNQIVSENPEVSTEK